jgi:lipopolysaccharide cholinephosphotransferase
MAMSELKVDKKTHQQHQQMLLVILDEFDRVCKLLDIPYLLFAGTMLGAVRHGGFIPWDDDLDVVMARKDYERFLREADRYLDREQFFLQKEYSEHWPMFFSKLRKNNTACIEKWIPKDPQVHQGVYIDIFPCDNLSDHGFVRKLQFAASKVVIAKSLHRRGYQTDSVAKKVFMGLCGLLPMKPMRALAMLRGKSDTQMVHTFFGAASKYEKNIYERQWLEQRTELDFEGRKRPASACYDALLTRIYGDYMTPPPEEARRCKIHAQIVDLERSYEQYVQLQQNLKITEYSRSIR